MALVALSAGFGFLFLLACSTFEARARLVRSSVVVRVTMVAIAVAMAACSSSSSDADVVQGDISIDTPELTDGRIVVAKADGAFLTGTIRKRGTAFSFLIADTGKNIIQRDDLSPSDRAFDEDTEEFEISISSDVPVGTYTLKFFDKFVTEIKSADDSPLAAFTLQIEP